MQSPQKLRQRLSDLLGPPGPDSDPLELVLRTVVQTTAPMVEGVIDQYTPESLDEGLEGVALYFLKIRSDERELSLGFLQELAKLNVAAVAKSQTIEGTSSSAAAEIPAPADHTSGAAPAAPADSPPASPPAPAPSESADAAPAAPDPSPASEVATDASSSSAPPSPVSPASSTPDSPAPASGSGSSSEPAPPWGG